MVKPVLGGVYQWLPENVAYPYKFCIRVLDLEPDYVQVNIFDSNHPNMPNGDARVVYDAVMWALSHPHPAWVFKRDLKEVVDG